MAKQNHPKSKIEKEKDYYTTLIGYPLATILLHRNAKLPWEITSTEGKILIPRVMATNIIVYALSTDIRMDSNRRHHVNHNQQGVRMTQVSYNNVTNEGLASIRTAIIDKNQDVLKTILNHQPNLIKCTDEEGLTPLSFAAYNGHCEMVHFFLKKFPESMKNPNKDNSYPIHKACLGGHVEVLRMFYDKNHKWLFAVDRQGKTVMHLAAEKRGNKLKEIVSYLLSLPEGRELLNKKDENRNTPLMLAENNGNREVQDIIRNMQ